MLSSAAKTPLMNAAKQTATRTRPMYLDDANTVSGVARVMRVIQGSDLPFKNVDLARDVALVLDQTLFYPQGGGQPSDTGYIFKIKHQDTFHSVSTPHFRVKMVRLMDEGEIYHIGSFVNVADDGVTVQEQDQVVMQIDAVSRELHRRYHTAGHVISVAVRSFDLPDVQEIKGHHFPGEAYVEFQGTIPKERLADIQTYCDKITSEGRRVQGSYPGSIEEMESKCLIIPNAVDVNNNKKIVRIVDVQGIGAYPCGGTHVDNTADLGKMTVKKISHSKGHTKISYFME
jgi:Ser-tRNA(Ala) deacylase AlaX